MRPHLVAQHVLVRMLYDSTYAAAIVAAPREVLPELPHELADALGAIDLRALRRDTHRRERTLGELCRELPITTTLVVHERSVAPLLAFYGSAHFHEAIAEQQSLVFALASYVEELLAVGELRHAHVAPILAVELASARARRGPHTSLDAGSGLRRAAGVEPVEVPAGTLQALQRIAPPQHVPGHLPKWSAVPHLAVLGAPVSLCAVCIDGEVSLVEIERALYAVLVSLPQPRARVAVLDEATLRIGDRASATAALDELIADELVLT